MALNYNGTTPTAIKYNGTDLKVLKYGTTAVWGKPYSLTITKDSYTTVTVNRTSSPNQGASTGNLSSGSVIYHGDVLRITITPNSGYKITTLTINGTTPGGTITNGGSLDLTIEGATTIVAYSVVAQSWHTIYSGSYNVAFSSIKQTTKRSKTVTFSGLVANVPTKITIGAIKTHYTNGNTISILSGNQEFAPSCGAKAHLTDSSQLEIFSNKSTSYLDNFASGVWGISIDMPTSANALPVRDATTFILNQGIWIGNCTITKIEQYY